MRFASCNNFQASDLACEQPGISRGEERTNELNSKYEGLTFEDLSNFKSEASVQQWEGEDFRTGVCFSSFVD